MKAGNKAPTYVYRFDADTHNNVLKQFIGGVELYREPAHGADLAHLFKTVFHNRTLDEMSPQAYKIVQIMVNTFTNFASTGNPSVSSLRIDWPPVTNDKELLMGLNIVEDDSEIRVFPEERRMRVFDEIWDMEHSAAATLLTVCIAKLIAFVSVRHFIF